MSVFVYGITFNVAPVMSGASIQAATIPAASVVGTALVLSNTAQTAAGLITFSQAPVMSGASISAGTIPAASVTGTALVLSNTAQTVAGDITFSQAPNMSGADITSNTIPAASTVGTAMVLSNTAQTVAGSITFSQPPIMSGASIASGTIPAASVVNVAATLNDNSLQTFQGAVTFDDDVILNAGVKISTGATAGYVLTSDGSGNATWAAAAGDIDANVQTTNATVTTLITAPCGGVSSAAVVTIEGVINAASADYSDAFGAQFRVTAQNLGGGAGAAIVGSGTLTYDTTSIASASFSVSGSNLLVRVTGLAGITYNWHAEYRLVTN